MVTRIGKTSRFAACVGGCALVAATTFCSLTADRLLAQEGPELLPAPGVGVERQPAATDDVGVVAEAADEYEILTRGPVHEAFAEPVTYDPAPNPLVDRTPPEPIKEVPPEYKPAGEDVAWISGYWAWDDQREDFLWVSGVWRKVPPGQRWVPGYWDAEDTGYRWVSGFWTDVARTDLAYLEPPPQSLEQGPTTPQPQDDMFWVPGCWVYDQGDYAWRPGYWREYHEDWVWVPAHYTWTPAGCVYTAGYRDYSLANRGLLYAPVYYPQPVYSTAGYAYRPRYVLRAAALAIHWFVRPYYGHYYFGNYYGPGYRSLGIYPAFRFHWGGLGYDPFYSYYNTFYGIRGIRYADRIQGWYDFYQDNADLRPAGTWSQQLDVVRGGSRRDEVAARIATPMSELLDSRDVPLERIADNAFARGRRQLDDLSTLARQRMAFERDGAERLMARGDQVGNRGRESLRLPELSEAWPRLRESGPRDERIFERNELSIRGRAERDAFERPLARERGSMRDDRLDRERALRGRADDVGRLRDSFSRDRTIPDATRPRGFDERPLARGLTESYRPRQGGAASQLIPSRPRDSRSTPLLESRPRSVLPRNNAPRFSPSPSREPRLPGGGGSNFRGGGRRLDFGGAARGGPNFGRGGGFEGGRGGGFGGGRGGGFGGGFGGRRGR